MKLWLELSKFLSPYISSFKNSRENTGVILCYILNEHEKFCKLINNFTRGVS